MVRQAKADPDGRHMDDITPEAVLDVLKDVNDEADYNSTALVDDRVLDSFDILQIISSLDDEFDIKIPAKDVVPENFNSVQAIYELVARLAAED